MTLLSIIHFLHISFGMIWFGGTMISAWAIIPTLAKLPRATALRVFDALGGYMSALMGSAGGGVMITGLLRAWLGGGITSMADLTSTYALLVGAALLLVIIQTALDGRERRKFYANLETGADNTGVVTQMKISTTIAFALVVAIMTVLGLGLY